MLINKHFEIKIEVRC